MKKIIIILSLIVSLRALAGEKLYLVKLKASNVDERSIFAKYMHIDEISEDSVTSIVREPTYKFLKEKYAHQFINSYMVKELKDDHNKAEIFDFPKGFEEYRNPDEVNADLKKWSQEYSSIAKLESIGKTAENRDIWAMTVTGYKGSLAEKMIPGSLFVGNHHAREHLSTEVALNALHHILENYGKDDRITNLVNNRVIYFIPQLNPDGAHWDLKGQEFQMWRKNRRPGGSYLEIGTDLNRNYPVGWGDPEGSDQGKDRETYAGPRSFSEKETIALRDFVEKRKNISMSLSFHSFGELILYPWAGRLQGLGTAAEAQMKEMAETMAKFTGYKAISSQQLYKSSGEYCDWAFGVHGIYCWTIELPPKGSWNNGDFYPKPALIEGISKQNFEPVLYLIEKSKKS